MQCCSEFTIAKYNGTIVNDDRAEVQELLTFRMWPTTVKEYEDMMSAEGDKAVRFTRGGDADIVKFLFYKVCFGMLESFYSSAAAPTGYVAPTAALLKNAEQLPVGRGDPKRAYYLYVAVQPPSVVMGDNRPSHTALLRGLQMTQLTEGARCVRRKQYPVGFSDALASHLARDLTQGRVHALVWGASGFGWECARGDVEAPMSLEGLCALLAQLDPANRPACIFLCMTFGARHAAERLVMAGAPIVAWVSSDLLDEDRAGKLLYGVCAPLLDAMHEPRASPDLLIAKQRTLISATLGAQVKSSILLSEKQSAARFPLPLWQPSMDGEVWVHNLTMSHPATTLPAASKGRKARVFSLMRSVFDNRSRVRQIEPGAAMTFTEHYMHFELCLREPTSQQPIELLERLKGDAQEVVSWVRGALPSQNDHIIAALYHDMATQEDDTSELPVLCVRILVGSVGFLHELRDLTLTGELDDRLSASPLGGQNYEVVVNRGQFAESYEASVLSLDKLTPHQKEKLQECLQQGVWYLHLKAPAGAGKTFVAMYLLLERLKEPKTTVLFVARAKALCYFVARWICNRVKNALERVELLRRVIFFFEPFELGLRVATLVRGSLEMQVRATPWGEPATQVIVDEAHHIYKDHRMQEAITEYVHPPSVDQRLLILSDTSQSDGSDITYPVGEAKVVHLTQVVRSSQRIVAGAASFQIGENKQQVVCQHNANGPPLKSFLFELSGPPLLAYAEHAVRALQHVISTFGSLSLHDRVAILVPDDAFAEAFRAAAGPLANALLTFSASRRKYRLIDATEAAALVMSVGDTERIAEEWLIVDTVSNFDGLERLIVIAIGLDSPVDYVGSAERRSELYRALTRAHMMAIVVNEIVPRGFFSFLGKLSLSEEQTFDQDVALKQQNAKAIDVLMEERTAVEERAVVEVKRKEDSKTAEPAPDVAGSGSKAKQPVRPPLGRARLPPPIRQSVWDTSANAMGIRQVKTKFNPFKVAKPHGGPFVDPRPSTNEAAVDTRAAIGKEVARVNALTDDERGSIGRKYTDPEELFNTLDASGGKATLLLRASWVKSQHGMRLPKRGDALPPAATITVAELRDIHQRSTCEYGALPVIALSQCVARDSNRHVRLEPPPPVAASAASWSPSLMLHRQLLAHQGAPRPRRRDTRARHRGAQGAVARI